MYSWIASWFTGGDTDLEDSAYVRQDKPLEKEDWIWVEMITEGKNDGLIFVQSARSDLKPSTDDPEPRSKSCASRKRSFSADVHESARKRARGGRSSASNRDLLDRYFPTVGLNLPKSVPPYRAPASAYIHRSLELCCERRDVTGILTVPRKHAPSKSPFRRAVSEILARSYSQPSRNQCSYPDMDWSIKSAYIEPGSATQLIIEQLANALNLVRQELDHNGHDLNKGSRKPLRSIWWRYSEHQPGEIFPRATRHRIPLWLRRITPGCVEYVEDDFPHWLKNIRLFDDAGLCKQDSIVMHDVPQWMRDINVFLEEAMIDDESLHFMPHWMKRIEVDKLQISHGRFLCNHSLLCHSASRNASRFFNRFPSRMSESNFFSPSDELFVRRCPWNYQESVAKRRASDWEPRTMQVVRYDCRALVSSGCREIVPVQSRQVLTRVSEYCQSMRDILRVCILSAEHLQTMNPTMERAKVVVGSMIDSKKIKVCCAVVSRKQEKRIHDMTSRWRQKQSPSSRKNLIRSNKMIMSRDKSRKSSFFQSKTFQ